MLITVAASEKDNKMNSKLLPTLWIFLTVNFIFCDVFTLMHPEDLRQILAGEIAGVTLSQEFLLAFAVIMEIPMLMIVISKVAERRVSRILNIASGIFLIIVQAGSLTTGDNSLHYIFFSIIEIAALLLIVWIAAWRWKVHPS